MFFLPFPDHSPGRLRHAQGTCQKGEGRNQRENVGAALDKLEEQMNTPEIELERAHGAGESQCKTKRLKTGSSKRR